MRAELHIFERVESYLLEEMSASDRAQFESEILTNSTLATQVEFQKNLMTGLENVALKAAAKSAYGKFKLSALINKIFLSCLVVAVTSTAIIGAINYFGEETAVEPSYIETNSDSHSEGHGDEAHETVYTVETTTDSVCVDEESEEMPDIQGGNAYSYESPVYRSEGGEYESTNQNSTSSREGPLPPNIDDNDLANNTSDIAVPAKKARTNLSRINDKKDEENRIELKDGPMEILVSNPTINLNSDEDPRFFLVAGNATDFYCQIYRLNRDGAESVHEITDPNETWDGRVNGQMVPTGIYFYTLSALDKNGERYRADGEIFVINDETNIQPSVVTFPHKVFVPDTVPEKGGWYVPSRNLETMSLQIYQRRGDVEYLYFETDNPDEKWDGTNGGLLAPEGDYGYRMTGTGFDGVKHSMGGGFTLDRSDKRKFVSTVSGLWIEVMMKKGGNTRLKTSNISDIISELDESDWDLMVPNENLSSFRFRIYDDKRKRDQDLVYMTFDPDFRWKFKSGEVFHQAGRYYYTIDAKGVDGQEWFLEDEIVWDAPKNKGESSSAFPVPSAKELDCSSGPSSILFFGRTVTPNGDAMNDTWKPKVENMKYFKVKIYNESSLVFQSTDPDFEWDATLDGKRLPTGKYQYEINSLGCDDTRYTKKGKLKVSY